MGSLTSARAMATRCCWPPESCAGLVVLAARRARPARASPARAAWRSAGRHAGVQQRQLDVLQRRRARQQVELLEHEADPPVADARERVARQVRDVLAGEPVAARRRRVEAADQVHERRLARAGRPHDRDELALGDVDRHAGERAHLGLAQRVDLDEIADRDQRHRGRRGSILHGSAQGARPRRCPDAQNGSRGALLVGRAACALRSTLPTITSAPSFRSPPVTSVALPSVRPRRSATSRGLASAPIT